MHFALVYLIELLATNSGQDGKLFFFSYLVMFTLVSISIYVVFVLFMNLA